MKAIPKLAPECDCIQWTGENTADVASLLEHHGSNIEWCAEDEMCIWDSNQINILPLTHWLVFSQSQPLILSDAEFHERYEVREVGK